MKPDEANRRSSVRKRPKGWLKVDCRRRGSLGPSVADVVWDVSQTGLCLVMTSEMKPGQELELQITSSSLTQVLKLIGKIIWIDALDNNKYSAGIRFEETLPYQQITQLTL